MLNVDQRMLLAQVRKIKPRLSRKPWRAAVCVLVLLSFVAAYLLAAPICSTRHGKSRRCLIHANSAGFKLPTWLGNSVSKWSSGILGGRNCSTPKVALLFLTKGDLPHEQLWQAWFASAAGLVPLNALQITSCGTLEQDQFTVPADCRPAKANNSLDSQLLFSVYVHPKPEGPGVPEGSLFSSRVIDDLVDTTWGTHSLVDAERALLQAALQDPLNQRFVLLSEAGIPLYPPALVYQQLMADPRSRVNACPLDNAFLQGLSHEFFPGWGPTMAVGQKRDFLMSMWRYHNAMPGVHAAGVTQELWRKSSQFFSLTRKHAELVASNNPVNTAFSRHCFSRADKVTKLWYECISDEHYIPTLLAVLQLENETDCSGTTMSYRWSTAYGNPHPYNYSAEEITPELFHELRQPNRGMGSLAFDAPECRADDAVGLAHPHFVDTSIARGFNCTYRPAWAGDLLNRFCPLFARKFSAQTVQTVLSVLQNCSSQLHILSKTNCHQTAG